MKLLAAVIAAATAAVVQAQISDPVLGIRLGKPFEIRKCEGRRDGWCSLVDPLPTATKPTALTLMPPDADSPAALPTWIKREKLYLELKADGVVDQFAVTTYGPSVQDRAVESISARFGQPVTYEKRVQQNLAGVKVEAVFAVWKTADAAVIHVCPQMNSCTVRFLTAEAYATELDRMQQRRLRDKL